VVWLNADPDIFFQFKMAVNISSIKGLHVLREVTAPIL
jgi:hypothetical protein